MTWVVGASGLLGRQTYEHARRLGHRVYRRPVPWTAGPADVAAALEGGTKEFLAAVGSGRWNIAWVAGAGVIGTADAALYGETEVYATFLAQLRDRLAGGDQQSGGALFVASSAGGVYAGSTGAPFTENSPTHPLATYGRTKLIMEAATVRFAEQARVATVIGRISNLYGPGQDIGKAQGLISQLARSYLTHRPLLLYVPLDTRRDYLYVGDCARLVLGTLETVRGRAVDGQAVVKILASDRSTTIAELLGMFQRIAKRRVPVVLGDSPTKRWQVLDLRVRSRVWIDLDHLVSTTLPAGIAATITDLATRMRRGELVSSR